MKIKLLIFFNRILTSLLSIFIVLYAIKLGFAQQEVGVLVALMSIGNMLSSLIFGTYAFKIVNKLQVSVLGIVGIFISLFILFFFKENLYIYLSAFLFSFFNPITYFCLLAYYKDVKTIEFHFSLFWLVGLGIGIIIQNLLTIDNIILLILLLSLLFTIISTLLFLRELLTEFIRGVLNDFGILPIIEKIVIKEEEILFNPKSLHFSYIEIKKPKVLGLHLTYFLIFIAFGLIYPQMIPYMKSKGFESFIFIFSLIGSTCSTLFYKILKEKDLKKKLRLALLTRIFMFSLILLTTILSNFLTLLLIFIIFWVLDGITWATIVLSSNSLILQKYKEEFGVNNLFRSLGYIIGSMLSGICFQANIFIAIFLLIITQPLLSKQI